MNGHRNFKSPMAIKMLKFAMNLMTAWWDNRFCGEATRLAYMTEEAKEGRNAFLKRKPKKMVAIISKQVLVFSHKIS
jgi:naphthoate synthase